MFNWVATIGKFLAPPIALTSPVAIFRGPFILFRPCFYVKALCFFLCLRLFQKKNIIVCFPFFLVSNCGDFRFFIFLIFKKKNRTWHQSNWGSEQRVGRNVVFFFLSTFFNVPPICCWVHSLLLSLYFLFTLITSQKRKKKGFCPLIIKLRAFVCCLKSCWQRTNGCVKRLSNSKKKIAKIT